MLNIHIEDDTEYEKKRLLGLPKQQLAEAMMGKLDLSRSNKEMKLCTTNGGNSGRKTSIASLNTSSVKGNNQARQGRSEWGSSDQKANNEAGGATHSNSGWNAETKKHVGGSSDTWGSEPVNNSASDWNWGSTPVKDTSGGDTSWVSGKAGGGSSGW
jgi:hypothetical protein